MKCCLLFTAGQVAQAIQPVKGYTMENKAFEDTSIFQGWTEYFDYNGTEWRREDGDCAYGFFMKQGDAFMYQGNLIKSGRLKRHTGINTVHNAFIDSLD